MAQDTRIEWADHTFNPWTGCTKVSPACDHCYAEAWAKRSGIVQWGPHAERRRTTPTNWALPKRWNAQATAFQQQHGRRQRVFCASLADVFDNQVPDEWRAGLFELIRVTPQLDWLLLTKRPQNIVRMVRDHGAIAGNGTRYLLENVILGTTAEDQTRWDQNIPALLRTRDAIGANLLFVSVEPMLGPIDCGLLGHRMGAAAGALRGVIDWVICGGESGPGARPMHPQWARNLRDQCAAAGVPFLFKQWGEWTPGENVQRQRGTVDTAVLWDGRWHIHPLNLATDSGHVDDEPDLYRVGKKAAGRLLDGIEHNAFPGGA